MFFLSFKSIQLRVICFCLFLSSACFASPSERMVMKDTAGVQILKRSGFQLNFVKQDVSFNPDVCTKLQETFFKVYPALVNQFNKDALKKVTIRIDTAYDGVAYASNGRIVISQAWLLKNPEDIDVVTHEAMHIVQAYHNVSGPGWLIEGIADYVRYKYGLNNRNANWALPAYRDGQHYKDSYRISARFLLWLEEHKKAGIVATLDHALRSEKYTEDIWMKETNKSLDQLWAEYIS